MYLSYQTQLRNESDETAIAHLKRKGWVENPRSSENHQWQNGAWVYVEPTPAPLADAEAWQVRVWMVRNGIDPSSIPALIESAIPAGPQRDEALQQWEYAVRIPASNTLVALVAQGLGLTVAEVWPDILAI